MDRVLPWRLARFPSDLERNEFVNHALSLEIDGIEVVPLDNYPHVRFRAPAQLELGIAAMVDAHGGRIVPSRIRSTG